MEVSLPGRVPINPLFLDDYPIKNPILTLTIWINHDFHSIFTTIIGETRIHHYYWWNPEEKIQSTWTIEHRHVVPVAP